MKKNIKDTKGKKENKKKRMINISVVTILLVAVLTVSSILIYNHFNKDQVIIDGTVTLKNVTGKLADYIKGLGNNYYIRYLGEFGKKGLNEELIEGTVEFTKKGNETAIYSEAINMHVVTDTEYSYNIMHKQKMILKVKLPVQYNTEEYNLISDFGQRYIADVSTKVGGVEYIYQEYEKDDMKIRYYFVGEELRYIRVVVGDSDRKINVIVDRNARKEMFELPKEYSLHNV